MLVQTINTMTTGTVNLPEGRDALDNTKTKTNNTASQEALETVANVKEALASVVDQPEDTIVDPEISPVEATGIEAEEVVGEETVEEVADGDVVAIGAQVDTLEFDPGDGNLVEIAPQYNALINVPDDDNKQILAYYLAAYDEESVSAITAAFSSDIESDPYALLKDTIGEYIDDYIYAIS